MRQTKAQEKAEREAAREAEEARVKAMGDMFAALPEGNHKAALLSAITDRIIHLYNECKHEQGDAILEFLPNDYARALLDWYFDDAGPDFFECPAEFSEQPDVILEVFDVAEDLVALWDSPKIQGLARADRNEAIDSTRTRLKEAVYVAQDLRRSARDQRPSPSGTLGQPVGTRPEAAPNQRAPQAPVEGETSAGPPSSRDAGRCADQTPSKSTSLLAK